jgi:hypothetical protein
MARQWLWLFQLVVVRRQLFSIASPKELAERMAGKANLIKDELGKTRCPTLSLPQTLQAR